MTRSFRFAPPELRDDVVARPRLMRALLGRWRHRVTVLAGGPGLGKTTVLVQALAENRLAPRGEDAWFGVRAHDADGAAFGSAVLALLRSGGGRPGDGAATGGPPAGEGDPATVADEVWRRSPVEVCLVFDDVHLLTPGSAGASWLAELVEALPGNGHVVMATRRTAPPVPLARLDAQGTVLRLGPDDLCFSGDELADFATRRDADATRLAATGGWPAMAELTARAPSDLAGAYLWEEILEPLGEDRRHVLASLCELGGADDALMSAAVGAPVSLRDVLDGVPLVAAGADGWHVPHPLWRTTPALLLDASDQTEMRKRAVYHLVERERFDDAFELVEGRGSWELAPSILRDACLASDRHRPRRLGRWLSACPDDVRRSLPGRLATALHRAFTTPAEAVGPLRAVAADCRDAGDVDAELLVIAQLGRLAWFGRDASVVGAALVARIAELAGQGHPRAQGLAAFGRAVAADLAGDDDGVLAALDDAGSRGRLDSTWEVMACWLRGMVHLSQGAADTVGSMVEGLGPVADRDPALRTVLDSLQLRAWWLQGRVGEVLDGTPALIDAVAASGVEVNRRIALTNAAIMYAHVGELDRARQLLAEVGPVVAGAGTRSPSGQLRGDEPVRVALATASLQLAEGDEDGAARTLRDAIAGHGLDQGVDRKGWRQLLPLTYVLMPEARPHWDGAPLRGPLRQARQMAVALVATREGRGQVLLRDLALPNPGVVRAVLHHRLAAELAVALHAVGRPEGAALLEALGPAGRAAIRSAAGTGDVRTKPAGALLAVVPAPPRRRTYVEVLGPLRLRRDGPEGPEVTGPELRRQRLRALLAFLIGHRSTTRAAITAAIWPDLDDRAAANNLTVTLNYLVRLLEPHRHDGEPAYMVRSDGQKVELVTGDHLRIDVDDFDDHVRRAAVAEADGTPSLALTHHLAAVALHRGALHADLPEATWTALDREHYATRFVRAAVRAGQLLVGRGDTDDAEQLARRALDVDPWAEDAHGVLIAAALACDDRSVAGRRLTRCLAAMDELGVEPSAVTRQLARRLRRQGDSGEHEGPGR